MITSNQNPKIKLVRALAARPKERRKEGAFLAEGVRLLEEALAAKWSFRFALYSEGLSKRGDELLGKLNDEGVAVDEVPPKLLSSISETKTSQGIIAVLDHTQLPIPKSSTFLLISDSIRDPGNLGTLIRTAVAVGVQALLLSPKTTDAFAPKVLRAGMGAHFRLPIRSWNWDEIERFCKSDNLQIFLADMDGKTFWETDFRNPLALIIGGEAKGASQQALKLAGTIVRIPMHLQVESLNAGVAGAVLMFEIVRQRSNEGVIQ
jgi:RNA methyltransferase, TrmH family